MVTRKQISVFMVAILLCVFITGCSFFEEKTVNDKITPVETMLDEEQEKMDELNEEIDEITPVETISDEEQEKTDELKQKIDEISQEIEDNILKIDEYYARYKEDGEKEFLLLYLEACIEFQKTYEKYLTELIENFTIYSKLEKTNEDYRELRDKYIDIYSVYKEQLESIN